ncbi:MAG: DUF6468 domain-containing protein [Devosia sp.]
MMFGLPFGVFVESAVAVLLVVTIGYCVVLNERLKRLHADRGVLGQMVTDLLQATDLANAAVKELQTTAVEADAAHGARIEEAERFGIELANHVAAGQLVMERIAKITAVAQSARPTPEPVVISTGPTKLQSALQQLSELERLRSDAA